MKISRLSNTAKDLMSDDALEMVLSSEWMDFQFLTILSSRTRRNDRKTDITLLPCPPPAEIRARRSSRADDKAMTPSNAVEPLLFSIGINNDQHGDHENGRARPVPSTHRQYAMPSATFEITMSTRKTSVVTKLPESRTVWNPGEMPWWSSARRTVLSAIVARMNRP